MHDGIHQKALRIDEDVPLLAFDLLAAINARRIDPASSFSTNIMRSEVFPDPERSLAGVSLNATSLLRHHRHSLLQWKGHRHA
jgi:hypothetical protein